MIRIGLDVLRFNHPALWPLLIPLTIIVLGGGWLILQLIKVMGLFLGIPWGRW